MDKDKQQMQRVWYIAFFLVIFLLLLKYFPKAAYGLGIITLLVILFKNYRKK